MGQSLKTRVKTILYEEPTGEPKLAWDRLTDLPATRPLNDHEATSRLWGYAFGVAYGIARTESSQPDHVVGKRAYDVALSLFEDEHLHNVDWLRLVENAKLVLEPERTVEMVGKVDRLTGSNILGDLARDSVA